MQPRQLLPATDTDCFDFSLAAGVIVPPIPEKNAMQKYQMTSEFVAVRRNALQVFINRVVGAARDSTMPHLPGPARY